MPQISRGKFDHLQRATAGLQPVPFDGYGLRSHVPARPAPYASDPVLVHRLASLLRASFRPRLAASVISPLRFAITSRPSRCEEDFHLQTVKHARHTIGIGGSGYPLSPATPPGMRVRTGRFRKIEPLRAGGPIHRFATRASPLDRLPFRLHRLLNLKSSAVADWLAQCHS